MPPVHTSVPTPRPCNQIAVSDSHLRLAGLRQSAQTFGAIVGASIAAATFRFSGSNYIATFALSAIPAVVALLVVTLVSHDCTSQVFGTVRLR